MFERSWRILSPHLTPIAGRMSIGRVDDAHPTVRRHPGDDDMAAHARSLLTGTSVTVPFADGKLQVGTWQGIYLFEHRTHGHRREIVVTLLG